MHISLERAYLRWLNINDLQDRSISQRSQMHENLRGMRGKIVSCRLSCAVVCACEHRFQSVNHGDRA